MTYTQNTVLNKKYQVDPDILYRQIDNEAVLLHISSGMYYSLNPTSIHVWLALQNKSPFTEAIEAVLAKYDVERDTVIKDLEAFIHRLTEYGLITEVTDD